MKSEKCNQHENSMGCFGWLKSPDKGVNNDRCKIIPIISKSNAMVKLVYGCFFPSVKAVMDRLIGVSYGSQKR